MRPATPNHPYNTRVSETDPSGSPARALLAWYDRHRRDLPWRQDRDPYRVWLSEVMLQQTRVETVLPYYERFLERFPTVGDLAEAEEEEVLALWSGLGYYRRARQLHRAAREVARRGGSFPRTLDGLRELPGIGAYTAAAVASIAFGVAEPVLDGNVERVTSRLLATEENPKSSRGRRALRARAAALLDPERPGDSNQALMELGATLCTPRAPRCLLCPLGSGCEARAEGEPERYPVARRRRETERVRRAVAVVRPEKADGDGRILLIRRADDEELLAGTWELPWTDLPDPSKSGAGESELIRRRLGRRYGGTWRLGPRLGQVRHGITYRSIEVEIYRGSHEGRGKAGREAGFFDSEERRGLPLSSLVGKVLAVAEATTEKTAGEPPG